MSAIYDARQLAKRRTIAFREAAAKKIGAAVDPHAEVGLMSDGAFVTVQIWIPLAAIEPPAVDPFYPHWRSRGSCRSAADGDCAWKDCPQLRDGEPAKSGRHCPLDTESEPI